MIGDRIIVDAVVHPWNLGPENRNNDAIAQLEAVYAAHRLALDPSHAQYMLNREEFFTDISFETVAQAEFVESPVDFAILHALPNLGFALGHVTEPGRAAAFRDRHPNRLRCYGTVDTPIVASAIAELERQVGDLGIDGLKLYPAFYYDGIGEGWRLDGEDYATPLLEAAQRLGITHVAIHKALWLEPAPKEAFNIDDLSQPLARFPDLTFEMVHGGVAFLDQTIDLLQHNPNLYLTLETTLSYVLVKPRVFAMILGRLIAACGSDRLLFASGNNLSHPGPLIEAFANYQYSDKHIEEFGLKPLSEDDRRKILGLNALRMHGIDEDRLRVKTSGDVFAQARKKEVPPPWSGLRVANVRR